MMKAYQLFAMLILLLAAPACNTFQSVLPSAPTSTPVPTRTAAPTLAAATATSLPLTMSPSPAATPTQVSAATVTRAPAASGPGTSAARRIQFQSGGTSAELAGNLAANTIDRYVLRALGGQTLTVEVSSSQGRMLLQISGADGNPLKTFGAGSSTWTGPLPSTQDYDIAIATESATAAAYTLRVAIPPLGTGVNPEPNRIQFAPASTSHTVQGNLGQDGLDVYVLRALAGQTMTVEVTSAQGPLLLAINGADGDVLKSAGAGGSSWSGTLRTTQDYFLRVHTPEGRPASYILRVAIPPITP
jgi:hypothetical protein